MLSTAIRIADATKEAVFNEEILALAGELHTRRNELDDINILSIFICIQ
jgi:hypothetical protein